MKSSRFASTWDSFAVGVRFRATMARELANRAGVIDAGLSPRRLRRDCGPCDAGGACRSRCGPRRRADRTARREPQSDRLQDRAWRPQARIQIHPAAHLRLRWQRHCAVGGGARDPLQAGRCRLSAILARDHRHFCRTDRAPRTIRRAEAGARLACASGLAAAGGADHAAGICQGRGPRRAAHPDPCRRWRHRHLCSAVCQAHRPARHHDHQREERRFREVARRRPGDCLRSRKLSRTGRRLRHCLRHARRRLHARRLQGGEARRRRHLAERPAGSRFRPARRRRIFWCASRSG